MSWQKHPPLGRRVLFVFSASGGTRHILLVQMSRPLVARTLSIRAAAEGCRPTDAMQRLFRNGNWLGGQSHFVPLPVSVPE